MVARRLSEGERHLRAGEWTGWRPTHMMGVQGDGEKIGTGGIWQNRPRDGSQSPSRLWHGDYVF